MKQTTFASLAFEQKKKPTRRELFLAEMEAVVPWSALLAVIEPHYPKARAARRSASARSLNPITAATGMPAPRW